MGIGVDFHPDSTTYLTTADAVVDAIRYNPLLLLNHGYYVVTVALGASPNLLIALNIALFTVTNRILYKDYMDGFGRRNSRKLHVAFYIIFLLSLYRLHLSVHVLKDTLVVFFTAVLITKSSWNRRVIWLAPILVLRIFSLLYLVLFARGRLLYFLVFCSFAASFLFSNQIIATLTDFNSAEMNFREGVAVPSFQNLGFIGICLRMMVWPLLMLSGGFIFLSPSPMLVPIAASSVAMQVWALLATRRFACTIGAFGLLMILAALAPGFASYQRYCLPILTVLPNIIVRAKLSSPK